MGQSGGVLGVSRRVTIAVPAIFAAVALAAGCSSGSSVAEVGRAAPGVSGTTLTGSSFHSPMGKGRWVVVNFFATWCPNCVKETPQLEAFAAQQRAEPTGAEVVGVLYLDDSAGKAEAFAAGHATTWPIVNDSSGRVAGHYGVQGLPESFVINPSGRLVARIYGGVTVAKLDAAIGVGS